MDFNRTIDLIIKDLNEASEIIDDLKKYPGVPALQVELAKSKCRSAGDVIAMLKTLSFGVPVTNEPVNVVHSFNIPDEVRPAAEAEKVNKKVEEKKIIPPDGNNTTVTEKKTVSKEPVVKPVGTSMIADKFSSPLEFYEEQKGNIKTEKELSEHLKSRTITNLSEAIGISDKFLFIGEIFDGNKEAYYQAITRLNKVENLEDAMAIIMSYTGEKPESEAVSQLLDLVKLKFPANE